MRIAPLAFAALFAFSSTASAFCGFYVATSDEPLTNRASRVVLVHLDGRTIVTMASDVHGDPKQFALVIPVPTVIQREQVRIVKPEIVEHLADYSKPRLVQYFDTDPCAPPPPVAPTMALPSPMALAGGIRRGITEDGVRVEAAFSVEEYDIKVLAADESDGLIQWLNRNGYKMPAEAGPVVGSYIRQHMHFFVAKVNLERMKNNTSGFLRPIRVDYVTDKFMLPIRLGTVNATGPQDMIVLGLTRTGRLDVTNYRTVRMPTGVDIPEYVQEKFAAFYDAAFDRQVAQTSGAAVFEEYAWPIAANIGLCDPCSAPTLKQEELDELGATAGGPVPPPPPLPTPLPTGPVPAPSSGPVPPPLPAPARGMQARRVIPPGGFGQAFLTRLHVRYDRARFPEDLQFQETPDTEQYQARYVTHVAVKARDVTTCSAGRTYLSELRDRWRKENATLADLTGWKPEEIREAMVEHWERTRER
jgi:hypothetical protein